jgi:hypothetical protein
MAREQLSRLTYSQLEELSARLQETAETVRNPAHVSDLKEAACAVSDLATIKLELRVVIKDCTDKTAAKEIASLIGVEGN